MLEQLKQSSIAAHELLKVVVPSRSTRVMIVSSFVVVREINPLLLLLSAVSPPVNDTELNQSKFQNKCLILPMFDQKATDKKMNVTTVSLFVGKDVS